MKIFNKLKPVHLLISISLVTTVVFTGCGNSEPLPPVVKYKTVIKKVPVKCEPPEIRCEFKGEGVTPISKLIECIAKQKKALELCSKEISDKEQ